MQLPDRPTAWPLSLIAPANPSGSPETVGNCLLDLAVFPQDSLKVKEQGDAYTGWVWRGSLRHSDHLASVVDLGGLAVITAKQGQAWSSRPFAKRTGDI